MEEVRCDHLTQKFTLTLHPSGVVLRSIRTEDERPHACYIANQFARPCPEQRILHQGTLLAHCEPTPVGMRYCMA